MSHDTHTPSPTFARIFEVRRRPERVTPGLMHKVWGLYRRNSATLVHVYATEAEARKALNAHALRHEAMAWMVRNPGARADAAPENIRNHVWWLQLHAREN